MVAIFWDTVDIMVDMVTDMGDGLTTDMDTMDKPRLHPTQSPMKSHIYFQSH